MPKQEKNKKRKCHYRSRLLVAPVLSLLLPRDPSRNTLCRSGSLNGLRWFRLRVASNGRYICWMYGAKPPVSPELLGFINESHSCFIVFNGNGDVADELFLWCLRSCSCDCDCAAAKRPCSVDKPLTCMCVCDDNNNNKFSLSNWTVNFLNQNWRKYNLIIYLKVFSCFQEAVECLLWHMHFTLVHKFKQCRHIFSRCCL